MTGNSHNSHSAGIIRSRWDYLKRISRGLIPHHTEYGALRPTSSTSDRYPFPLLYHRPTETQETSAGVMLTWIVLPRSYSPSPYLRGDLWAMKWWLQNQHAAKTISLIARCLTFEIMGTVSLYPPSNTYSILLRLTLYYCHPLLVNACLTASLPFPFPRKLRQLSCRKANLSGKRYTQPDKHNTADLWASLFIYTINLSGLGVSLVYSRACDDAELA